MYCLIKKTVSLSFKRKKVNTNRPDVHVSSHCKKMTIPLHLLYYYDLVTASLHSHVQSSKIIILVNWKHDPQSMSCSIPISHPKYGLVFTCTLLRMHSMHIMYMTGTVVVYCMHVVHMYVHTSRLCIISGPTSISCCVKLHVHVCSFKGIISESTLNVQHT